MPDSNERSSFRKVSIVNGVPIVVPASFAGILPTSPCSLPFSFEPYAFLGLGSVLQPGAVAFDVGVSYGVMTTLMASLVGNEGRVYSFEANQAVLSQAREIVAENQFTNRVEFVCACVGESSGREVSFFVVPGLASVASTRNGEIAVWHSDAELVRVPMLALDDFCEETGSIPDCIKLDIEGSEYLALKGSQRLLERHRPDLVIETHGHGLIDARDGVAGFLGDLEELGYGVFDLVAGGLVTAQEFGGIYASRLGHALASVRLKDPWFVAGLQREHAAQMVLLKEEADLRDSLSLARDHVNNGRYQDALPLLEAFLDQVPDYAEAHYLLGYCLHSLGNDTVAAVEHYDLALENGFPEFWVRFNRGALWLQIGDCQSARDDLRKARDIDPSHEGVLSCLRQLGTK